MTCTGTGKNPVKVRKLVYPSRVYVDMAQCPKCERWVVRTLPEQAEKIVPTHA